MIAIPNMDKPKNAFECSTKINPEERMCIYTGKVFEETLSLLLDHPCDDCPLIEIDENDPMLLEFLNEFDKWRAYKELMDSIRTAQKKGEPMRIYSGHEGKDRICCNCRHNKIMPKSTYVRHICDIDGHYIGYIESFDCWCRRWAKERRADEID